MTRMNLLVLELLSNRARHEHARCRRAIALNYAPAVLIAIRDGALDALDHWLDEQARCFETYEAIRRDHPDHGHFPVS